MSKSTDVLRTMFEAMSPEDRKALAKQLMEDLSPENEMEEQHESPPKVYKPKTRRAVVNEDFSVTPVDNRPGHRTPVRAKQNQWSDTGENRDEDFDPAKYEEIGRKPRTRPAPDMLEVECHVCRKSFTANANTLFGKFYRCGRCTGR